MQDRPPEDQQSQTAFTPQVNAASGSHTPLDTIVNSAPSGNHPSFFYTQEQEEESGLHLPLPDEQDNQWVAQSPPFVLPFQNSAAMPALSQANIHRSTGTPPPSTLSGKIGRGSFHLAKFLLIGCIVLITVIGATFFVFAQSAIPATNRNARQANGAATKTQASAPGSVSQVATPPVSQPGQNTQGETILPSGNIPSVQLLNQIGWTQAGLSLDDALEALRTGDTFTDREMSYDYRNIGTLANHSGTLTSATFLLTPGAEHRFIQNDVRMINNHLYDKIRTGKIIQQVVNAQPSLIQFQTVQVQGQEHPFAWIDVTFELFQSKIDPATSKRTENFERDPTTGQPILHHLMVVLLRVSPQNQGANAPMGGTGWLVNTYELDPNTLPAIATHPTL